jgi:predicted DCC family thiol-disulfide oxidoreductase YuxK
MTRADPALAYPLTIYYDASCPLCRAELETLKARDGDHLLRLVDCSADAFDDADARVHGVTRDAMMRRIHARDAAGRWLQGLDVFTAVYRAAGLFFLARIYASRRLRPLLDRLYPWIADHRQMLSRLGLPHAFRFVATEPSSCRACARPPSPPPG